MNYRGTLHNHSTCSKEGCYPLSVLRERWAPLLDFVAMTEHAERITPDEFEAYLRECDSLSDDRFRFIPGLEVRTTSGDMLLFGCRKYIRTEDPLEVLRLVPEDTVVVLAHPEDGRVQPHVLAKVHGVEGWNGGHMGGYMPPMDWLAGWRRRQPDGAFFTGGNDVHAVDPKRKIVTLVAADVPDGTPCTEDLVLRELRAGHFTTDNGVFALSPRGEVAYKGRTLRGRAMAPAAAFAYRLGWRTVTTSFKLAGDVLGSAGVTKDTRRRLNRTIRQYL